MELTKIFTDGDTQTVRLPQDCRFDSDEVFIGRIGNSVVLSPKSLSTSEMVMVDEWADMREGLKMFTDDFLAYGIEDLPPQGRNF